VFLGVQAVHGVSEDVGVGNVSRDGRHPAMKVHTEVCRLSGKEDVLIGELAAEDTVRLKHDSNGHRGAEGGRK